MISKTLSGIVGYSCSKPLRFRKALDGSKIEALKCTSENKSNQNEFLFDSSAFLETIFQATNQRKFVFTASSSRVIIESGSPNVAKPFHPGNFRSTLLGNTISKLYSAHGHSVTKLSYLGDWGDQFNLLLTYVKELHSETDVFEKIRHLNVHDLLKLYAEANVKHETNANFRQHCDRTKLLLETGDSFCVNLWAMVCEKTMEYYADMNDKFGLEYDQITSESQYRSKALDITNELKTLVPYAKTDDSLVFPVEGKRKTRVPFALKDGKCIVFSTYLTRDIAAAIDRLKHSENVSKMLYVVDKGQFEHFRKVNFFVKKLLPDNKCELVHTQFGRVIGMSSRKGNAMSIDSLVEDARDMVVELLRMKETTKSDPSEFDYVADKLAIASLIVNCFSYKRMSDYKFNWNEVVSIKGKSGIYVLMSCAKIHTLFNGLAIDPRTEPLQFDFASFNHESEEIKTYVTDLMILLSNYESVLYECYEELDPFKLREFIYQLCKALTRLYNNAPCVSEPCEKKQTNRLAVFQSGVIVLEHSLGLIGVTPLRRI